MLNNAALTPEQRNLLRKIDALAADSPAVAGSLARFVQDYLDAAVSTRAVAGDSPDPAAYTNVRAALLDNLDAAVSSVGGVNWAGKSWVTSCPAGAAQANTHLNIAGSGYLLLIHRQVVWSVQVDGGTIYGPTPGPAMHFTLLRFNASLLVKSAEVAATHVSAWAVID